MSKRSKRSSSKHSSPNYALIIASVIVVVVAIVLFVQQGPQSGKAVGVLEPNEPRGAHDLAPICGAVIGWACDANDFNKSLEIHFYKRHAGESTFIGSTIANKRRESAVGTACGGNARHGFFWTLPDSLRATSNPQYEIDAYALNIGPGDDNPLLPISSATARNIIGCPANPVGWHDAATCTAIEGWTCDPSNFNATVAVHVYDGIVGAGGTFMGAFKANTSRESAVGFTCGMGSSMHGFKVSTPPRFRDGDPHNVTVYALNVGSGTENPQLMGSPRSLRCPTTSKCTDTDGLNYAIAGSVSWRKYDVIGALIATSDPKDQCVDAIIGGVMVNNVLREYYCDTNMNVQYNHVQPPVGKTCSAGRLV